MLSKFPPRLQRYLRFLAGGAVGYLVAEGLFALAYGERSVKWSSTVIWIVVGALACALIDRRITRDSRGCKRTSAFHPLRTSGIWAKVAILL